MADTLTAGTLRPVLVDGRNPSTDELITASDPSLVIAPPDADGVVFASVADGAADGTVVTLTVDPGADDVNRTSGSDDITFSVPVAPTPLEVTLG